LQTFNRAQLIEAFICNAWRSCGRYRVAASCFLISSKANFHPNKHVGRKESANLHRTLRGPGGLSQVLYCHIFKR